VSSAPRPLAATDAAIAIEDLTVAYADFPVLWDVDLVVPSGSRTGIVGPNGAGKSTLLKAILGLVEPVAGEIAVFGQPQRQQLHRIAYVPQRSTLDWDFPTDILDVVTMGTYRSLGWFRRPGHAERERARAMLTKVGLEDLERRPIAQLSGGQQQRVLVARALAQEADVYILDEPFQGVDAPTERAIVAVLDELAAAGKTVVAVHHDLQTVPEYFNRVLLLNIRAVASGPITEAFTEATLRETFGGKVGVLARMRQAEP
jgi:manganese/zinc/iron transport system ATP- binding protein